jgi:hypothetical protein
MASFAEQHPVMLVRYCKDRMTTLDLTTILDIKRFE